MREVEPWALAPADQGLRGIQWVCALGAALVSAQNAGPHWPSLGGPAFLGGL